MITTALTIALYLPLYSPAYYGLLSESPTTTQISEVMPFDDALQAVNPVIVNDNAESTQEKPTVIAVSASFYTARCDGCSGITKTGDDVRHTIYAEGRRIIAVDSNVIALRSIVLVTLEDGQSFEAIASDTGGSIKNFRIDVLVATKREAFDLGRMGATVMIIRNGGETNE